MSVHTQGLWSYLGPDLALIAIPDLYAGRSPEATVSAREAGRLQWCAVNWALWMYTQDG